MSSFLKSIRSIVSPRSLCTSGLFVVLIYGFVHKSMILQVIFGALTVIYYGNYLLYKDLHDISQERLKELESLYDAKVKLYESVPKRNIKKNNSKKKL